MRKLSHQTAGARKLAMADAFDFAVGDHVSADGFPGRVTAVNDAPWGAESYEVTLDNGVGAGEYTARQLSKPDDHTAAVLMPHEVGDLEPVEAATAGRADFWYPELGGILEERVPNERIHVYASNNLMDLYRGISFGRGSQAEVDHLHANPHEAMGHVGKDLGQHWTASYPVAHDFAHGLDSDGESVLEQHFGQRPDGQHDHGVVLHARVEARHLQAPGEEWGGIDPRHSVEQEYAIKSGTPVHLQSAHYVSSDGRQTELGSQHVGAVLREQLDPDSDRALDGTTHVDTQADKLDMADEVENPTEEPVDGGPSSCGFCGCPNFSDFSDTGRGTRARCDQCGGTMVRGEGGVQWQVEFPNSSQNAPSREGDFRSTINDPMAVHGMAHEADAGDWCRFRLNTLCMLPQRLNSPASASAGYTIFSPAERGLCNRYTPTQQMACPVGMAKIPTPGRQVDPLWSTGSLHDSELGFHFTATWAEVQAKAKRIRAEGGVRVLAATGEAVVGEVRGDNATYEAVLHYVVGSKKIADWSCGCKWGAYAWGRSPAYKRFEGRQCSHVSALRFEVGARGMFGRDISLDTDRMEGQHQRTPVQEQHQRGTDRSPEKPLTRRTVPPGNMRTEWTPRSRVRVKGSLEITPAQHLARVLVSEGSTPADVLVTLKSLGIEHTAAREVLAWASHGPESGLVQIDGEMHEVIHVDPHTDTVTTATGESFPAERALAPNWHPTIGLDPHEAATHPDGEQEATADPMGGTADPGTDIPRLEDRDQTDAKENDPKHKLHHTNDTRRNAPDFGKGVKGKNYAWCDQCSGSGCGHCGGTGQVLTGIGITEGPGAGDMSSTTSPIADQNEDAGDAISSEGLGATGMVHAAVEVDDGDYTAFDHGHDEGYKYAESPGERAPHEQADAVAANWFDQSKAHHVVDGWHHGWHTWNNEHETGKPHTGSYASDSFMAGTPGQTYQAPTPHSQSDNPVSTGWAASSDPPDWEQPIIGSGFGIGYDASLHAAKKEGDPSLPEFEPHTHAGVVLKAADTGRVLMIQRSNKDEKDPARGTWEFPGGGVEDGDATSLHTGMREFEEEVGQPFPPGGHLSHVWRSGDYIGHVVTTPHESAIDFTNGRATTNPDDPDGDDHEQSAWWDPEHARKNPALREECKTGPWGEIKKAAATHDPNGPYETCNAPECHGFPEGSHTNLQHITDEYGHVHGPEGDARRLVNDAFGGHEDSPGWLLDHQHVGPSKFSAVTATYCHSCGKFQMVDPSTAMCKDCMTRWSNSQPDTLPPYVREKVRATLHDEPEAALPSTDGASEEVEPEDQESDPEAPVPDYGPLPGIDVDRVAPWGYPEPPPNAGDPEPVNDPGSADHDMLTDDATNNLPFRADAKLDLATIQANPVIAAFSQTAGFQALVSNTPTETASARQEAMTGVVGPTDYSDAEIAAVARTMLSKVSMKEFSFAEQQELINEGVTSGARARNFGDLKLAGTHYAQIPEDEDDGYPF